MQGTDSRYRLGCMRSGKDVAIQALLEMETPPPSIKINMWPHFNEITGGLRAREFTILCGATGSGKTTFLANLSAHLLMQKVPHYVASVETGDADFVKRVCSVLMEEDLNTGDAIPFEKLIELKSRFGPTVESDNIRLAIFDNRFAVELLISELQIAHDRYGCKIAMLDNLNFFMEVCAEKNQIVEMDRTVHELIMFCKRTDMHLIMVMHPKKTDHGRVETEFDIKGSSTAVQEAHNVFLFNRTRPDEFEPGSHRELKIAKLRRRGKHVGKRIIYWNFNTAYQEKEMM
jgi:KaiC/GvpD/RAD55 family RecA-like ATPase